MSTQVSGYSCKAHSECRGDKRGVAPRDVR